MARTSSRSTAAMTYPTVGHLNLVTVSYTGGPGANFNIFSALRAWLTPDDAVVPESEIFNVGQTQQQVVQQDTQQMLGSQEDATAAALCYLNIKYTTITSITATVKGTPAYGVLRPGDDITAVDGTPGRLSAQCRHDDRRPEARRERSTLTIDRKGVTKTVTLTTKDNQGKPQVGSRPRGGHVQVPVHRQDQSAGHRRSERRADVRPRDRRQALAEQPDRWPLHRRDRRDRPDRPGRCRSAASSKRWPGPGPPGPRSS